MLSTINTEFEPNLNESDKQEKKYGCNGKMYCCADLKHGHRQGLEYTRHRSDVRKAGTFQMSNKRDIKENKK
jgi:hypothetical protein